MDLSELGKKVRFQKDDQRITKTKILKLESTALLDSISTDVMKDETLSSIKPLQPDRTY